VSSVRPATPGIGARRRNRRALLEWLLVLLAALAAAFALRAFALQAFYIPSASMEPTLEIGDRILVDKAFFNWHDLHEGDIVVFRHPPLDTHCSGPAQEDLVKRVIALPGQRIYSVGNNIFINGKRLAEPYLPRTDPLGPPIPDASKSAPYLVPKGELYVMGDNRQISCDSRYWGPVKGTSILGKVILRWWHNGHPDFHLF